MVDDNVALTLNSFFSDVVTSLNIPKFKDCNSLFKNIRQPVLSAILNPIQDGHFRGYSWMMDQKAPSTT